jgi:hypothetical protein
MCWWRLARRWASTLPDLRVELDIDKWAERVDRDMAWAALRGVTGVPAYLLYEPGADGLPAHRVSVRAGMQRYDELRAWVVLR